ncbi:MAG: RHS repeat-associated core domain-containing protein, partial [Acidobacteriota bacterium]|nr:RHS repeat-associated core domain-containing protein [Acidobacteriota bacterium]
SWTRRLGSAPARVETYSYDNADQLVGAVLKEGATTVREVGYGYDAAGNRTSETLAVGSGSGPATDYERVEWDAAQRVTAIIKGGRRSEFGYDGLGRRVRIVEKDGATVISDRRYVWDGAEVVEERDGTSTGVVTKRYFGSGVRDGNETYFYTRDHLGSVREVIDGNGNLAARYDYDPWGRPTQVAGSYRADWGYAGYWAHRPSGLNLTWYRAYDAEVGRWLSRDPIGETGGLNLYEYVGNNPVRSKDRLGLQRSPAGPRPNSYIYPFTMPDSPFYPPPPRQSWPHPECRNLCQDQAGRYCDCHTMVTVSIWNDVRGIPPHTYLQTPYRTVGHYPWTRGNPIDSGRLVNDSGHFGGTGQSYKVCPQTMQALEFSINQHANDNYDVTNLIGRNCTGWACERLADAGLPPPIWGWLPGSYTNPWRNWQW